MFNLDALNRTADTMHAAYEEMQDAQQAWDKAFDAAFEAGKHENNAKLDALGLKLAQANERYDTAAAAWKQYV